MQVVIIVFISILVVSFITGLFITYFEKKDVVKNNSVVDEDNKNVSTSVVSAVHDISAPALVNPVVVPTSPVVAGNTTVVSTSPAVAGNTTVVSTSPAVAGNATVVSTSPAVAGNTTVVVSPVNVEKTVNNFDSSDEILGETMVLDVPEIIRVLNDEDIETI